MLTAKKPIESPDEPNPLNRLISSLEEEGFSEFGEDDDWSALGERVWHRPEKVLFATGETVFVIIEQPEISPKIIDQAVEGITQLFRARTGGRRALSVLQTTTVYVVLSGESGAPHPGKMDDYIAVAGGVVVIPVVMIPEINLVRYPNVSDLRKGNPVRVRVEYLRYMLRERSEAVSIHRGTVSTFWLVVGAVVLLAVAAVLALVPI